MKIIAVSLTCLLAAGDAAFAQQTPAAMPAAITSSPLSKTAAASVPGTLLDGTAVKLRLSENLSSANAKMGQQVSFEVIEDVSVDGMTVILKGAQALATVTEASSKKSMGRGGKLDVSVESARLVDGENVALRGIKGEKGGGHVGAMTGAIVATSIVFFPAAPLFLFIHGKDITIPKGTEVTAFVQGDKKLDMARMAGTVGPGTPPPGLRGAPEVATLSSLVVESNVAGADISLDGAFVGSTPSTISVTPGKHTIAVKRNGYTDWSRAMDVSGSNVHLLANLEANPK